MHIAPQDTHRFWKCSLWLLGRPCMAHALLCQWNPAPSLACSRLAPKSHAVSRKVGRIPCGNSIPFQLQFIKSRSVLLCSCLWFCFCGGQPLNESELKSTACSQGKSRR